MVVIVVRLLLYSCSDYLYFKVYKFLTILMTNISVILVSGGDPGASTAYLAELLYTNGTQLCSLPNLPQGYIRSRHSQTGLTCCGGTDYAGYTTCHTLSSNGSWEQSHSLSQRRRWHSSWASPQGTMLIGGGFSGTTTEILTEN